MIKELRHIQLHDMMSYLKAVVASLVLCFTIQSCDKEMGEPESTIDDNSIGFNAGVEKTRAVATIDHVQDKGFKVWGGYINTDGTAQQVFAGTAVTYDDTDGWGYSPAKYWNPGKTYHFFGVYPQQDPNNVNSYVSAGELSYNLKFSVPTTADTDLMVATPDDVLAQKTGTPGAYPTVSCNFTHALARINFNVKKAGGNTGNEVVVRSITINNVVKSGTYNSRGGWDADGFVYGMSYSANNLNVTLSETVEGENVLPIDTEVKKDILFIPQTIEDNQIKLRITYTIKVDNAQDSYVAEASIPKTQAISSWEAQKIYTYNVQLGAAKNEILFSTPTVNDWKNEKPVGGSIIIQ